MNIAIFGNGKSAQAILEYLNSKGIWACVYDDAIKKSYQMGSNHFHPASFARDDMSDLQIISPGIPPHSALFGMAKNPISEYDFFDEILRSNSKKIIWISGTNGKTTTTEMLEHMLNSTGLRAKSGANIGYPVASVVKDIERKDGAKSDFLILESSSFMLHYTKRAYPDIYILLPVFQDHISWHRDFDSYVESKISPLRRMSGLAFVPENLRERIWGVSSQIVFYENSADLESKLANLKGFVENLSLSFAEPFLLDALLALSAYDALVGMNESAHLALLDFKIAPHRMEEFIHRGVLFVDDSKATNISATKSALKRYEKKKIFLILGGDGKGGDYEELIKDLKASAFLIGTNARDLALLCEKYGVEHFLCFDLQRAMHLILDKLKSQKDVTVLLSPASSSLDQFRSYVERGNMFQQLAKGEK